MARPRLRPPTRARLAYVYVRQSSVGQVLRHSESTDLQYRLVERAVALGWPRDRISIIDEDLGKSGASVDGRAGVAPVWLPTCHTGSQHTPAGLSLC